MIQCMILASGAGRRPMLSMPPLSSCGVEVSESSGCRGMTKIRSPKSPQMEIQPDAWARFERAVHVVAKSPPQHRMKREFGKPDSRASKKKSQKSRNSPKAVR
jgi:hypothetical protein